MSLRVVVADDQGVIREGFAALLAAQDGIDVVGTAGDGAALVDLVLAAGTGEGAVDLALVDVRMPLMDGIEATRRITAATSCRVLVLTTFDLDEYVYAALRAGASGFLLKDVQAARLVEGVRLVGEGSMLLGPAVTRRLVEDVAGRRRASAHGESADTARLLAGLSTREREVLEQLAAGRSNAEIAQALFIGTETVKTHVGEVLHKLALRDRVQAVVWAYEHGLVLPGS